jgi:hypothetical protein
MQMKKQLFLRNGNINNAVPGRAPGVKKTTLIGVCRKRGSSLAPDRVTGNTKANLIGVRC